MQITLDINIILKKTNKQKPQHSPKISFFLISESVRAQCIGRVA